MVKEWIKIAPLLFIFFACAPAKPVPQYMASKAVLEKLQPNREIIPARKGCDVCHRVLTERVVYKYYPVRMSHKSHAKLGIECIFCHRGASASARVDDYLVPAGHGFSVKTSEGASQDKNPCRVCHIYSSPFERKDRREAKCKACHPSYSSGKPLPYKWVKFNTNLVNNHKAHYDRGIPCLRCHVGFDLVEEAVQNYIPKMDICNECHGAAVERKIEVGAEAGVTEAASRLYRLNCAMCHGLEGKGDGPVASFFRAGLTPRDLTDSAHMAKRTDQQIHDVILKGGLEIGLSEKMPAWEGLLKEDEISSLVQYIRNISEKPR